MHDINMKYVVNEADNQIIYKIAIENRRNIFYHNA